MYKNIKMCCIAFLSLLLLSSSPHLYAENPLETSDPIDFSEFFDETTNSRGDASATDTPEDDDQLFDGTDDHEAPSLCTLVAGRVITHSLVAYYACKKALLNWRSWAYNHAETWYNYLMVNNQ